MLLQYALWFAGLHVFFQGAQRIQSLHHFHPYIPSANHGKNYLGGEDRKQCVNAALGKHKINTYAAGSKSSIVPLLRRYVWAPVHGSIFLKPFVYSNCLYAVLFFCTPTINPPHYRNKYSLLQS